ncbi:hypothetical protein EMCRGX_G023433 [Ephydatia muelleri]
MDFQIGRHVEVASLEAIVEMMAVTSFPEAPYVSTTPATHTHLSSERLGSFNWCFRGLGSSCGLHSHFQPGPPQNGIQSTQQQQAAASVINSDANVHVYETIASQQPAQLQNIAGSGQVSFKGNYQPLYFGRNIHPHQGYFQDPTKMAYATLPMQPYPTSSMPPQLYGGNCIIPPQQPVMVVQQQPTSVPISTAVRTSSGDNYLTLSVLMTFLVLIIGGWPSLFCTISALLISYNAKDDEKRGNIAAARTKANISLGLNSAAVVFVVVMWSVVAIPVAVTVSAQTQLPTTPTPYCYSTQQYPSYCFTSYCYYYYCYYNSYYSYSSYSYHSYYYSQDCYSAFYSLVCSYG